MKKKLVRSNNRVFAGVLGGIANYFNIDATIVRIIFIGLFFGSYGTAIFLYLIMALVIPSSNNISTGYGYNNQYYEKNNQNKKKTRKEAEKVEEDDDWSDF